MTDTEVEETESTNITIRISGASDDLIEIDGLEDQDEINVSGKTKHWSGDLVAGNGEQLRVHANFDGCWAFGIGQVDEDHPLPFWSVNIAPNHESDHSVLLLIEAPGDTTLVPV